MFLYFADFRNKDNELSYTNRYSNDSLNCATGSKVTPLGFFIFSILLISFLIADFANGSLMIYESMRKPYKLGFFAVSFLFFITTY